MLVNWNCFYVLANEGLRWRFRLRSSLTLAHTPRNEFGTLQEGRKKYPPLMKKVKQYVVNGTPVGGVGPDGDKRDFSQMPDLQSAYMLNSSQHNIGKAIAELRSNVRGFLVEMPLDWAMRGLKTPRAPLGMTPVIAENHSNSTQEVRCG